MAGLPALQDGESGQVRKEAATAVFLRVPGVWLATQFCYLNFLNFDSISRTEVI